MPKAAKNIIGLTLRRLRVGKNLTQEAFAAQCQLAGWDVTRATISKIEAGLRRVNDAEILMLQKVLNIQLTELFPLLPSNLLEVLRHSEP